MRDATSTTSEACRCHQGGSIYRGSHAARIARRGPGKASGAGPSSRSAYAKRAAVIIVGKWPRTTKSGSSQSTPSSFYTRSAMCQSEAQCVARGRCPEGCEGRRRWQRFRHHCLPGDACQRIAATTAQPRRSGGEGMTNPIAQRQAHRPNKQGPIASHTAAQLTVNATMRSVRRPRAARDDWPGPHPAGR